VGHPDVAVGAALPEGPVALERQGVVVGRVGEVGDGDVLGVDDVPAVAVTGGGDGQVVGGDVVAAVDQGREVAAALERDPGQRQAVAAGQRDDLVGLPALRVAGDEFAAAVDGAGPDEPDVGQPVAPDHRVVEVAVPEVLELVVGGGLRRV